MQIVFIQDVADIYAGTPTVSTEQRDVMALDVIGHLVRGFGD